jgi:hypothetical protein
VREVTASTTPRFAGVASLCPRQATRGVGLPINERLRPEGRGFFVFAALPSWIAIADGRTPPSGRLGAP